MSGIVSWIVCGVVAGYIMNVLIAGRDKGLVVLTLSVGVAGAIIGGFVAHKCVAKARVARLAFTPHCSRLSGQPCPW